MAIRYLRYKRNVKLMNPQIIGYSGIQECVEGDFIENSQNSSLYVF